MGPAKDTGMNDDWDALRRRSVRARLLEKRSKLLSDFLNEHGLAEPKSVEFSPLADCVPGRCFVNVENQVRRAGGSLETGWVFWELEGVSIHTEAHGIWVTPQGRRKDITPRALPPERRIPFLPDPRVAMKRGYTAGYRTILSSDPRVRSLETYVAELARIFDDCFPGMNREMDIPMARVREAAERCGLPTGVAKKT